MSTATAHLETHFHFAEHRECRVLTESVLQQLPGAPETGVPRRVRSDELVYAMGDPTGEVFFLRRGQIALSVISDDGREQRLRAVEPGEMFGDLCFCDVRARREQARALADSEVVALVVDDLLQAILRSPEGTAAMLGTMCARVSEAEQQVQRLAFHTVPERVGLLLLSLRPFADADGGARVIETPPTHEAIAQTVGASRELVSATLSGLRRLGLIRYRRRSAMLIYPRALADHLEIAEADT